MKKMVSTRFPSMRAKRKILKHAPKLTKNVTNDVIEGKLGRIYIPDQKIGKMGLTSDIKGLKRERRGANKNKKHSKKHSKEQKVKP